MRAAVLAACAAALLATPAAGAKKKAKVEPYVDTATGFALALPGGWRVVGQDTERGVGEPLLKVTNDATDQWLVVIRQKGPADDVYGDAKAQKAAQARFEEGFKGASGFKKISFKSSKLPRKKGGKAIIPAYDLWFRMQRDEKPVVVGVRTLFFKSYALTLVVDSPGKKADAGTKKLLESFVPAIEDE